ncbi:MULTISPECIES: DUF3833 domain-containing protein [Rhodobacterales]|uniref:DUF3833 domain-containing protein n=2 Tax=Rhodobacterales TaxID=204455 RepID=A0A1H5Z0C2_9RHOB|nr:MULTISPECIES: DUF3833 domain-containing protein [Rhodobacterales]SEG29688.1 Protein of unknown function [Jhaorihella thermophila]SHF31882.1 Protein of unknown function [Ruegeria intermedia]
MLKLFATLFVLLALGLAAQRLFFSFAAQSPARYAGTEPAFDLRTHLGGMMISEGVIFGPTGAVTSRFVAEMNGAWEGATGRLSESFRYASGMTQERAWTITVHEGGRFTATAPDIMGQAEGVVSGATARLTYRLRLPQAAGGHVLDVVDWMYLAPDGVILNRSQMRKFGVKVAELVATIRPAAERGQ